MEWIRRLQDILSGKIPKGVKRSPKWPKAREAHLKQNKYCACCGGTKRLQVHHVRPFWIFPELELSPKNLITLCEGSRKINCHFILGHLMSWKSFNVSVRLDCTKWLGKVLNRPDPKSVADGEENLN